MDQACGILPVCSTILNSVVTAISNLDEEDFSNSLSIPSYPQDLLFLSFLIHFKTSSAEITFSKCVQIHQFRYHMHEEVIPRGCCPASQNVQQKDHG